MSNARKNILPKAYFDAWVESGMNYSKAADALGVVSSAVQMGVKKYKRESGDQTTKPAWMPPAAIAAHSQAPEGYYVKGVSTYYGDDGEVKGQWVKTNQDEESRAQALIKAIRETYASEQPIPTIRPPEARNADLLTVYPIGDAHFGMHAWGEETGEDFDLKIVQSDLVNAVRRLVRSAPKSETALIVNVGDFIHIDDGTNKTPRGGNNLDADSRYVKIVRVATEALRTSIDLALRKHQKVKLINARGNHDPHSSVILTIALGMYYSKNPRVEIEQSSAPFIYHEFGNNFLGVTHGDTCKPERLQEVMSNDRPAEWGRTKFRHWLTGHIHTKRVFEVGGCLVESFRTLAARDGYATTFGYRSGRDMNTIVYHREFGEVERHRVDVSMVRS